MAAEALRCFDLVAGALGVGTMTVEAFQEEVKDKRLAAMGLEREAIDDKIAARAAARADKRWDEADAIRAELESAGVAVMDLPGGVVWRVRL